MRNIFKTSFVIIALLQSVLLVNAQEFLSVVPTTQSMLDALEGDLYIQPKSGIASEAQPGEGIQFSFDGNQNTIYHSRWDGTVFPVTLDYMFDSSVSQIDYAIYHPRSDGGTNGNFNAVEVWYKADGGEMTKYGDYNFDGEGTPSTINFEPALVNPETIRFVVKSGRGDGVGFASCAEMEFYRKNSNFDYTTIFADAVCSELKPEITIEDINAIPLEFYRKMASDIYHGDYDMEFRVQDYPAYLNPTVTSNANRTAQYGRSDGITGIYVGDDTQLVVFVETESTTLPTLFVHNAAGNPGNGNNYTLRKGLNKIHIFTGGLIYIRYYTNTGTEPPAKINIVNGIVNGYYDKARHTPEDWPRLLDNATHSFFVMKGDYTILGFLTNHFRAIAKDNGPALLDFYDNMVLAQQDFMGILKFDRQHPTRMCLFYDPTATTLYATSYYTGYSPGSQTNLLSLDRLTNIAQTGDVPLWGPAHEVGHVNQLRPHFRWSGMTEVTNNILSEYTLHINGFQSRIQVQGNFGNGKRQIVENNNIQNYLQHDDVFTRLVPFMQLYIYMVKVLGQEDFYKDLCEQLRKNPTLQAAQGTTAQARYMLEFVYEVCRISGYDMTQFFTDWKFLYPASFVVDDYGTTSYTITQQGIDSVLTRIKALELPAPPVPEGLNLYEIHYLNWPTYVIADDSEED